jgi:phosphatidate cytidylyltransferase
MLDGRTFGLIGGVLVLLGTATAIIRVLKHRSDTAVDPAILENFRLRVRAWWFLTTPLAAAFLIAGWPRFATWTTVGLFWLLSFWALREFITLTPTRPGDHRALFWVFFLLTPAQYLLVGMNWYELYSILIPVYAFLFLPARIAMSGDPKRLLERTAKIEAGLLITVYALSYAPALLNIKLPPPAGQTEEIFSGRVRLLFFFIVIVQLSDVLQYAWAQLPSKHPIVPTISPTKTWEGLIGGAGSVTLLGAILWWATPFPYWMAGAMSLLITLMGFAGSLTMSAIKRDRGVKDYGTLIAGHGGVLDRIDTICFTAPIFFHFTQYYVSRLAG